VWKNQKGRCSPLYARWDREKTWVKGPPSAGQKHMKNYTRKEWGRSKLHSKRVGKIKTTLEKSGEDQNYTRKEWGRLKLHSKRVEKIKTTLEKSGEDLKPAHIAASELAVIA
jgi:hypothetical protein